MLGGKYDFCLLKYNTILGMGTWQNGQTESNLAIQMLLIRLMALSVSSLFDVWESGICLDVKISDPYVVSANGIHQALILHTKWKGLF